MITYRECRCELCVACKESWKPFEAPELPYDCIQEILRYTDWHTELRLKAVNRHFNACIDLDRQKTWRRAARHYKKSLRDVADENTALLSARVTLQQRLFEANYRNSMLQQQLDWDGRKIHSYD
jgi:hypothetical protein